MSISYPLTPPSTPKPSSVIWTDLNSVAGALSQYTRQRQNYDWGGCALQVQVEIDSQEREGAAPWMAFLSSLRGTLGTFLFGDALLASPLGAGGGTPKVKGAGQVDFSLDTDGWPNSTLVLKAGDMISIANHLHRVLTDTTSDGSGNATIDIFPHARGYADNANVTVNNPVGTFRLTDNAVQIQDSPRTGLFLISFTAIEAVPWAAT